MDDSKSSLVCAGKFHISGVEHQVTLTKTALSWQSEKNSYSRSIHLKQILAVLPCDCPAKQRSPCRHCQQTSRSTKNPDSGLSTELLPLNTQAFKLYYAVPKGKYLWKLNSSILQPLQELNAKEWISIITKVVQDLQNRTRSLLVFINPYGGRKKAQKIYQKKVFPIFQLAGIKTQVVVTERANHAQDMIQDISLDKYDGIVCVGGDGMFCEILNGVIMRAQQDGNCGTVSQDTNLRRPIIPIGVIPAGSTDAVCYCTTGINDVVTSTLLIAMGERTGIDVNSIHHNGALLRYGISFLSYGYFGDTIVESEKHRWMGPSRYNWSGFKTFLRQRSYEGELTMKVIKPIYVPSKHDRCTVGCPVCLRAKTRQDTINTNNSSSASLESSSVTVTGKFKIISSATLTCRCGKSKAGVSPTAHLGDGCTDIIILKKCSSFELLRFLIRTAINNRSTLDLRHVEFYRVQEFSFSPYTMELIKDDAPSSNGGSGRSSVVPLASVLDIPKNVKISSWNCDGEILREPEISVRVHCQLVNIYGLGIEDREKSGMVANRSYQMNIKIE